MYKKQFILWNRLDEKRKSSYNKKEKMNEMYRTDENDS